MKLIPVLRAIAENEERDVRKVIKHYRRDLAQYAIDFRGISPGNSAFADGASEAFAESEEQEDFSVASAASTRRKGLQHYQSLVAEQRKKRSILNQVDVSTDAIGDV